MRFLFSKLSCMSVWPFLFSPLCSMSGQTLENHSELLAKTDTKPMIIRGWKSCEVCNHVSELEKGVLPPSPKGNATCFILIFFSFLSSASHFQEWISVWVNYSIYHLTSEWLKTMDVYLELNPPIIVLIWSRPSSNDLNCLAHVSADGWQIGWQWMVLCALIPSVAVGCDDNGNYSCAAY